jgi:type IV pilus assembly protein PilA
LKTPFDRGFSAKNVHRNETEPLVKHSIQKGFTLVELMIVVAIIGILAAVALPQYQNYTIRARVSQGVTSFESIKTCIGEQYQANGTLDVGVSSLCSVPGNRYFGVINPSMTGVTVTGAAASIGTALTASLTNNWAAISAAGGTLTWTCTGSNTTYFPTGCRG